MPSVDVTEFGIVACGLNLSWQAQEKKKNYFRMKRTVRKQQQQQKKSRKGSTGRITHCGTVHCHVHLWATGVHLDVQHLASAGRSSWRFHVGQGIIWVINDKYSILFKKYDQESLCVTGSWQKHWNLHCLKSNSILYLTNFTWPDEITAWPSRWPRRFNHGESGKRDL